MRTTRGRACISSIEQLVVCQAITARHAEAAMAGALQRRGSLPNKIVLALQQHSEQHQTMITFEVRTCPRCRACCTAG